MFYIPRVGCKKLRHSQIKMCPIYQEYDRQSKDTQRGKMCSIYKEPDRKSRDTHKVRCVLFIQSMMDKAKTPQVKKFSIRY